MLIMAGITTLPSPFKARIFEYFKADGTEGEDIRNRVPTVDGREYNGQLVGTWGPTPTAQTTLFRDPCIEERDIEWDVYGGLGYTGEDLTQRQCQNPYYPSVKFSLERKPWTEEHKLNGISWIGIELMQPFYDSTDLSTRFYKNIPKIELLVKGIKPTFKRWTYDAMGNRSLETVTEWTDNPVALLYWYDRVRRGFPEDAFDEEAIADAYEVCEELVSYTDDQIPDSHAFLRGNNTTKRYACNIEIESGMEPEQVYAMILATCAGFRFEVDGKIIYRVGEDRTYNWTITDEDFVQVQAVKPWPSLDDRVNRINAIMEQSEETNYRRDSLSFVDTHAETRDGEQRPIELNLAGVQNQLQAGRVIANLLRGGRESLTLDAVIAPQIFMTQFDALPGDVWRIAALNEFGFTNKDFVIQSIRKNFDGTASITFKEDISGTYSDTLILPELTARAIEFEGTPGTPIPDIKAIETPVVAEGRCVVHDVETYPPDNTFGKNGDRAYDRNGVFGIKTNDEWQRFSGRWWPEGRTGFVVRYKTVADLPEQPLLTDTQRQTIRRGGAFISVIDNTHQVFSYSLDRGRQIQIMNICEQTASPGLIPGIPCNLCYRLIEDWGDGSKFPFLDATPTLASGILYKQTDLTVYQVGTGTGQTPAARMSGDVNNTGTSAFGNGYWIWSQFITAQTTQDPVADEILGTNTRIVSLGIDYRGGSVGLPYRQRTRFFVDLEQIDSTGASVNWTEDQRDNLAFLLVNKEAGEWRLWWNRDLRDTEPFRGNSETSDSFDSEQGSLLTFFKDARDNSQTVDLYVIDLRQIFIGQALRMDWGPPSFGNYSGFETSLAQRLNFFGADDRGITYTSDQLTDWPFDTQIPFTIRTNSSTGRSGTASIDPFRRDIREANLLASAAALAPSNIDSTSVTLFTVPPTDAVSAEFSFNQQLQQGDPTDNENGTGTTETPSRIQITGLVSDRFVTVHMRYLGASQATGTKQSNWFGCLYRTLEDRNRVNVEQVTGIYFDPVTANSAVARWSAINVPQGESVTYVYDLRISGSNVPLIQQETTNLSASLLNLEAQNIYSFNIFARVRSYVGESASATLVTLASVTIPQNLNVTQISTNAFRISCDPIDCIDAFNWQLENQFGRVLEERRTTEPFIEYSNLLENQRFRVTVSTEIDGQSSYRTGLQVTTCLTDVYKGDPLTYTLDPTDAVITLANGFFAVQGTGGDYLTQVNIPSEPDFAGGKISSIDFTYAKYFDANVAGMTGFDIEFNAKTGNLFTQAGFNTDAADKVIYLTFNGFNYEVRGRWTFVSTSAIRLTPTNTGVSSGTWAHDLGETGLRVGDTISVGVAQPLTLTPGTVPLGVGKVVYGVEGTRPTLRWEAVEGVSGYELTIFRGEKLILQRMTATNETFEDLSSLTAGYTYVANVVAITDGRLHLPKTITFEIPGTITGGVSGNSDDMVAVDNILATVDKDRIIVIFDPATTGGEHTRWGFSFRGIIGYVDKPRIEIFEQTATFSDRISVWPVRGENNADAGPARTRLISKRAGSLGPVLSGCIRLVVSNIGNNRACIQWNIPYGATKYAFRTNTGATTAGFGIIFTNGIEVTGLSPSTDYFYAVRAVSAEGREWIEEVVNFSTLAEADCGTPQTDPCSDSACDNTNVVNPPGIFIEIPETCGQPNTPPCVFFCPPQQRRNAQGVCELIPCPANTERRTPNTPCVPTDICANCPDCQSCKTGETVCTDNPCPPNQERLNAGECCVPIQQPCESPCVRAAGGICCCPDDPNNNCNIVARCGTPDTGPCPCPPCQLRFGAFDGPCINSPINCPSGQSRIGGNTCCTPDCPPNQSRSAPNARCCPTTPCPAVSCLDGTPATVFRNNQCECESICADLVKTCPDGTVVAIESPCPIPCAGIICPEGQILTGSCECIAIPPPPPPDPSPNDCLVLPPCPEGWEYNQSCICTRVCSCPDIDGNPQIEGTTACNPLECGQYCECHGTTVYAEVGTECPECPPCNPNLAPCPEGFIRNSQCQCEDVTTVIIFDPCRHLAPCPEGQNRFNSNPADCSCTPEMPTKTCRDGTTVPVNNPCPCNCPAGQICDRAGNCTPITTTKTCPTGEVIPTEQICPCPTCKVYNPTTRDCQPEICVNQPNRCETTGCCFPACPPPETMPAGPGITGSVTINYTWDDTLCQCLGTGGDIVTVNCICPGEPAIAGVAFCPPTECPCPPNYERPVLPTGLTSSECVLKPCPPGQSRREGSEICTDDPCPAPQNCYERIATGQPCVLKKTAECTCPPDQTRDPDTNVCVDAPCPMGKIRRCHGNPCIDPCPSEECPSGQLRNCECECRPAGCSDGQVLTSSGCEDCPSCPDGERITVSDSGDIDNVIDNIDSVCGCEPDDEAGPCPNCQERPTGSTICSPVICPSGSSRSGTGPNADSTGCCKEDQKFCAGFSPVPTNEECPCPSGQRRNSPGGPVRLVPPLVQVMKDAIKQLEVVFVHLVQRVLHKFKEVVIVKIIQQLMTILIAQVVKYIPRQECNA